MERIGKKAKAAIVISGVAILIGVGALWIASASSRTSQNVQNSPDLPQTDSTINPLQERSSTLPAATSPAPVAASAAVSPPDEPTPAPAADNSDREKEILTALRASFEGGGLVSRIRLQDELNWYWQENPPEAEELTSLIADGDAPPSFRIYMAKVFRNEVKRRRFEPNATSNAFAEVRGLITDDTEIAELRAEIANILTMVDQSDATIRAVSPLLSENDAVAAQAVAALCNTTNPLAIETLYRFVTDTPDLIETNPHALAAALPPLSTTEKDVVPVVRRVVDQTDNFDLYRAAVQALMHTEPSPTVLDAIAQAHAAAPRFGERRKHAEHLCRAAARKHSRYFEGNKGRFEQATEPVIEEMLQPEDGQ